MTQKEREDFEAGSAGYLPPSRRIPYEQRVDTSPLGQQQIAADRFAKEHAEREAERLRIEAEERAKIEAHKKATLRKAIHGVIKHARINNQKH